MKRRNSQRDILKLKIAKDDLLVSMDDAKRQQFKLSRLERERVKKANYNLLGFIKQI